MSSPLAIATCDLTRTFPGGQGVSEVELAVPEGTLFGFLGPNGAGKTTTIRLLLSLLRPDKGQIELLGEPLTRRSRAALRQVGALVETPSLYSHLTGRDNLEVTRRLLDLPRARVAELLELVDLSGAADRPVRQYSLGMRQRLALALALLPAPRLLVLDEPANGLDPAGIQALRNLLRRLVHERGLTVFLSSHLLSEIELLATHVAVLHRGELLFQGPLDALRQRSRPKVAIRVSSPETARALLSRAGFEPDIPVMENGDQLLLAAGPRVASDVARLLIEGGVELHELVTTAPSLEALFFELTDGRPETGQANGPREAR